MGRDGRLLSFATMMSVLERANLAWFLWVLAGCNAPTPARNPGMTNTATEAAVDRLVDIGGTNLYVHCVGAGTPAVVLEAGLGNDHEVWSAVQPGIAKFARVCAYDRAGLGRSGPPTRPHSNQKMAQELHTLLNRTGVSPPYILVAHSMGGINVRLLASEHPDEVAGMVLIDAVGDDQPARFWALIPESQMAEFRAGLEKLPEGVDYNTYVAGIVEMKARGRVMRDKPLVILTRGKEQAPPDASPELASRMLHAWHGMQADLRHLSTNSIQLIAKDSGHFIHREAPQLVVSCVRAVVDSVRARVPLNVTTSACRSDHSAPTVQ
jgi:pimeloyl-ACP methyl ester carboxylesterase